LQEKATELAANKKSALGQPAAVAAPPGKPPKGAKVEAAPPPPPEPQLSPRALEEENRRKAKVTSLLLSLYKKKRQTTQAGTAGVNGGVLTPRADGSSTVTNGNDESPQSPTVAAASSPTAAFSPSSFEVFPKHPDVPADLWAAMLSLREERLQLECTLGQIKACAAKGEAHLHQIKSMGHLASYAVGGSEHGLRVANAKLEEKLSREQAAAREAAVATPGAIVTPLPPSKKK
jgi:hypothetical protein